MAMQLHRYENADENKFWEIWIDDVTVFMRFGKNGSQGQTKLKKCADAAAAAKEEKRFITEKEKQGFSLVASGTTTKPRKALKNPELEKAIVENPDSPDAYLVYGDWLSEQGDPLGEFVALHAGLAKKKDKSLQKKADDLLKANEASWLGDLTKLDEGERQITWRYGFMEKVALGGDEYSEADGAEVYTALRKLPTARFIRDLEMRVFSDDDGQPNYNPILKLMASSGLPPTLRRLAFDVMGYQVSWTDLGDLSKLYPQLQNLEILDLHVGKMKFGVMNLPNLRRLTVKTGGFGKDNIKSVSGAKWPKLETLHIYFGDEEYGCNCGIKDLAPLLDGKPFPKVTDLALCNAEFQDDIAKAVAGAKITKQLKSLDLSKGKMSDEGAQALLDGAKSLAHLESLDVSENWLSDAMVAKLKKAFGKKIDASGQGDPEEEYKYVQVAE